MIDALVWVMAVLAWSAGWSVIPMFVAILVHEAGHALAASHVAPGGRILVALGIGPLLTSYRRGRHILEIRPVPLAGWTRLDQTIPLAFGDMVLLHLAGVAANALAAAAIILLVELADPPRPWRTAGDIVALWQILMILSNSLPLRLRIGPVRGTDGWQLLDLLRQRRANRGRRGWRW